MWQLTCMSLSVNWAEPIQPTEPEGNRHTNFYWHKNNHQSLPSPHKTLSTCLFQCRQSPVSSTHTCICTPLSRRISNSPEPTHQDSDVTEWGSGWYVWCMMYVEYRSDSARRWSGPCRKEWSVMTASYLANLPRWIFFFLLSILRFKETASFDEWMLAHDPLSCTCIIQSI